MSRLALGNPLPGPNGFQQWVLGALKAIEQASAEDIEAVLSEFSITGTLTERRSIDAGTATLDELRDFLCTMVNDIKKGGQKRSYGS